MPSRRLAERRAAVDLGPQSVVRKAVLRFLAWSLVALVIVGIATVAVSEHIARDEALRDAKLRGASMAHSVTAPLVDATVRAGDPDAVGRLATVVRNRMLDGSVNHVKIWSSDGQVIWSDDPSLTGRFYKLPPDAAPLFGTKQAVTDYSQLDRPEDELERQEGPLLEVFVGAYDADGVPVVVESHMSPDTMEADQQAIFAELLPLAIGSLLLFQLSIMPLSVSLARRVERSQRARADILRRALLSSELERRRLAQDLHDGVIQDLAGLSYMLPALLRSQEMSTNGNGNGHGNGNAEASERVLSILQRDIASLRTLMTDIYPPDLSDGELADAVKELAHRSGGPELEVHVEVPAGLRLEPDTARLAYRIVREGLRNVVRHAGARTASVLVSPDGDDLLVRVTDDGQGFSSVDQKEDGHLGVTLLADSVRDAGGHLDLRPGADSGTVLEARFPELTTAH
jgi:signal transduction histidine kinase